MMKTPGRRPDRAARNLCAIYTRKSSEEGLDQEFNSLHAQREECDAYILSQKSAGWIATPAHYDDGGISGGTLLRPALQRLLADIGAGRVDTVVVYKVDRLTRSLNDFAKIVEAFDAKDVSFVSVTQQFNTTTSMGRLTLNMLLSFAQFEREVTGERIRDKIAASKQKGMWMGGYPPLGYDVANRKLVVNPSEADIVRHIFRQYVVLKSVRELKADLDALGIISKARVDRFGTASGGKPIARGALYLMLQNRIYRGEIVHKGKAYPGLHDPIIDEALWDGAQGALAENRIERVTLSSAAAPSLLAGLVYDASGERMSPTHANKKGTRYRYYVSHSLIRGARSQASDGACRVPAADLERVVQHRLRGMLKDEAAIFESSGRFSIAARKAMIRHASQLPQRWPELPASNRRAILQALVARIDVRSEAIDIDYRPDVLARIAAPELKVERLIPAHDGPIIALSVPVRLRRTGMVLKLLVEGEIGSDRRSADRSLLRLLTQAKRFSDLMLRGAGTTIATLAAEVGVSRSYFTRVFRLSFLAPEITAAMLQGRQPPELTANKLMGAGPLPKTWADQLSLLGFR